VLRKGRLLGTSEIALTKDEAKVLRRLIDKRPAGGTRCDSGTSRIVDSLAKAR
jgi:hypothetical protein